MSELGRQAEQLAEQQKQFVDKLKQRFRRWEEIAAPQPGQDGKKSEELAREKEQMLNELNRLERTCRARLATWPGRSVAHPPSFVKRSARCSRTS